MLTYSYPVKPRYESLLPYFRFIKPKFRMKKLIQRSMFAGAALAAIALGCSATAASAATGPWNWTDVSSQVSLRQNRTVWAMVHSGSSYFGTDGLDLSVGRVWQTNPSGVATDLTSVVRNAGLTRVDDLATDGTTVLFLKNMNSSINSQEVVSYKDGIATNVTSLIQGSLQPNEGIASLVGSNGTWMVATTRGNLLSWNGISAPTQVGLTDAYTADIKAIPSLTNGTNGYVSNENGQRRDIASNIAVTPVNGKFLVTLTMSTGVKEFQFDGLNLSEVTTQFPATDHVVSTASNGANALLLVTKTNGTAVAHSLVQYDGSNALQTAVPINLSVPAFPKMTWTGSSWMILSGKNIYRFSNNTLESYGQTADFFTSIASDGVGNVLLGGAASKASLTDAPVFPLTAKLVSVAEGMSSQQTMATTNGTSFWTWTEPNTSVLHRDESTSYNVGAWDANGVKSIELFVNWTSKKTCDFGTTSTGNQNCKVLLTGSNYAANSSISLIGKVTDEQGHATWTNFTTLTVKEAVLNLATNTSVDSTTSLVTTWFWLEPNVSSVDKNGSALLHAQANAANGLTRMDFVVNGQVKHFCDFARAYGTQDCSFTLNGSDYALGSSLAAYVKSTDGYGKYAISNLKTIDIRDNNQNAGSSPATILVSMTPNVDLVPKGQEVTVSVAAKDTDGVNKIELLANGKVVQTCSFTNAYDTRECTTPVSAARYPNDTTVNMTGRVTDANGNVTLSDSHYYTITK